jgi:hypothetical protein
MSLPSNGITAEVIREMMPPYTLSDDLLSATLAALAPPPAGATTAWRRARITRLTREISAMMPANAAQAQMAADIVMARDMARTLSARGRAPELTTLEMGRVFRVGGELLRTAGVLVRTLERTQKKPAPFFGTVLADEVDIAALDAAWGGAADDGGLREGASAEDSLGSDRSPQDSLGSDPSPQTHPSRGGGEEVETDAHSTVEGVVTRLSEGPGWTLDVCRPRAGGTAGGGAVPESVA